MNAAAPLSAADFTALMRPLGPFEAAPVVAVAVSGGADSLCLCLLADAWARARGGRAVGLTVDHGLRDGSGAEAERVAGWLAARGIGHRILAWTGPKPSSAIQAAARAARYRLLGAWCREHGVLHLLLGHHRDDQAETVLMRLERGSGVDGLAAMPAVSETADGRLLRPLLPVAGARLRATLAAWGQAWVEDPSNTDPGYARTAARVRVRAWAAAEILAEVAEALGTARMATEAAVSALLAGTCSLRAEGWAVLDGEALRAAPRPLVERALARVVGCVGGGAWPPRRDRLARLADRLGRPATLGGCRFLPDRRGWLVCREARALPPPVPMAPGERRWWDRRFVVTAPAVAGLRLAALGDAGGRAVRAAARRRGLPAAVSATLPALWDDEGVFAVPQLGYRERSAAAATLGEVRFFPPVSLSGIGFVVVPAVGRTI